MDSAMPPISSGLPEKDREVLELSDGSGVTKIEKEIDLTKEVPSWASMAKDKKVLKKFEVEIISKDGKNKVQFPEGILSESTPLWEDFVVGKFLDIAAHIAKVHTVVNKIWSYGNRKLRWEYTMWMLGR